jgi:hypothetical protein
VLAAVVVALLAIAQLVLPRIAESVVRDRLGGSGEVVAVDVRAFPAVQLLWRDADRVTARVRRYDAAGVDVGALLAQTAGIDALDVRIGRVDTGPGVVLRDLRLRKEGGQLHATALLGSGRAAAALPTGTGRLLELLARGVLSSDARVEVERVAARPLGDGGFLLSALLRVR